MECLLRCYSRSEFVWNLEILHSEQQLEISEIRAPIIDTLTKSTDFFALFDPFNIMPLQCEINRVSREII